MEKNTGPLDALIQEVELELNESVDDEEMSSKLQEKLNSLKALKEDYEKIYTIASDQKIRAEKAEEELKKFKRAEVKPEAQAGKEPDVTPKKDEIGLTQSDMLALVNAKVHEDDVEEVIDYARLKGISVKEALKTSIVKTILAERAEERATAQVTATENRRSGPSKLSPDQVLAKARRGEMPEDPAELVEAQLQELEKNRK